MRPPIDGYGLLDFGKFEELRKIGYDYAIPVLKNFLKTHNSGKDIRQVVRQ